MMIKKVDIELNLHNQRLHDFLRRKTFVIKKLNDERAIVVTINLLVIIKLSFRIFFVELFLKSSEIIRGLNLLHSSLRNIL